MSQKILIHPNDDMNFLAATLNGIVLCFSPLPIEELKNKLIEYKKFLNSRTTERNHLLMMLWSIASFAERGGFKEIGGIPTYIIESIG